MAKKRIRMVAGNWKMNTNYPDGRELAQEVINNLQPGETVVVLAPPFIQLRNIHNYTSAISNVFLGAQNCHEAESGAYTGEISAPMLRSVGVDYVILGHSERRQYFKESDRLIADKIDAVMAEGMRPIFCCGEPLEIREDASHVDYVAAQLKNSLFHLSDEQMQQVVIAYEPIWAIGTGKTASPEQAQEMHAAIRKMVADQYGDELADAITILYGGSVKPNNAEELFSQADVDGGLIGGASLKAKDFLAIVESFG